MCGSGSVCVCAVPAHRSWSLLPFAGVVGVDGVESGCCCDVGSCCVLLNRARALCHSCASCVIGCWIGDVAGRVGIDTCVGGTAVFVRLMYFRIWVHDSAGGGD